MGMERVFISLLKKNSLYKGAEFGWVSPEMPSEKGQEMCAL